MSYKKTINTPDGEYSLHPETLMMSYGYNPQLSEGAVKPPVFLTSTFVFNSAEEGKAFFDVTSGRVAANKGEKAGLVYSRFNQPNSEIVEDRLALFEQAESCLLFSSGMSAISTLLFSVCKPGEIILKSQPLYGGTETLFNKILADFGIASYAIDTDADLTQLRQQIAAIPSDRTIAAIFAETPANPTNTMVDIALLALLADEIGKVQTKRPLVICDNTLLGPVFQQPLLLGADISVYSLTKYVGGNSDLVAGAAMGSAETMKSVRQYRSTLGTQLDPHSCWMLGRSLETLQLRMVKANENALQIAEFLRQHPRVKRVNYLPFLASHSRQGEIFQRQCQGAGSTFSFELGETEADAFRFLNTLQLFKLAVSLGGTESLISHPASTTHSGVPLAVRQQFNIFATTIRV